MSDVNENEKTEQLKQKDMFSIKMRASEYQGDAEKHISGAEKIVSEDKLPNCMNQLLQRALKHTKGNPDLINFKLERVKPEKILHLDALKVTTCEVETAEEGIDKLRELLGGLGVDYIDNIMASFQDVYAMRGAMLLNVDTLERYEKDLDRGIRVSYMDIAEETEDDRTVKNHFREALVLATKVSSYPNIIGELCISDDLDYVTGYFASKETGYVRVTKLKEMGSPDGGRIFLFRGNKEEAEKCIEYLEKQKILVHFPEVV
ncbi:MAG: 6-carboxyhexanoate--CoA ligase [Anaerocolumna sp.]